MHLIAAWTPEQWALIMPILGLQIVGIIAAWKRGGDATVAAEKVSQQVEAVHHEVMPPSNGTTAGAYFEASSARDLYLYDALSKMAEIIGMEMPEGWPEVLKVEPPKRPADRRRFHG